MSEREEYVLDTQHQGESRAAAIFGDKQADLLAQTVPAEVVEDTRTPGEKLVDEAREADSDADERQAVAQAALRVVATNPNRIAREEFATRQDWTQDEVDGFLARKR